MNYPPPPGYVPRQKPVRRRSHGIDSAGLGWGEVFRTASKVAQGYNTASTVHGIAGIAAEIRKLIRG